MAIATQKLTFEQFEAQYGPGNKAYEFCYGEAIPKGMPTWVHALLQKISCGSYMSGDLSRAPQLELRIDPDAHPRPDVVATSKKPKVNTRQKD